MEINERGTWKDPDSIPMSTPNRTEIISKQDNEIFQTARTINCGWFGFVVFSDYFTSILGLVRQGNSWSLDPFSEFRQENHSIFERGRGNVCSVEVCMTVAFHPSFLTIPCSSTVCIVGTRRPPRPTSSGLRKCHPIPSQERRPTRSAAIYCATVFPNLHLPTRSIDLRARFQEQAERNPGWRNFCYKLDFWRVSFHCWSQMTC